MPRMSSLEYQAYLAKQFPHKVPSEEGMRESRSEADLHDAIIAECRRRGWIAFHGSMAHRTHRTIGEPDFVILAEGGRMLLVECKSATGKVKSEQIALHAMAGRLGHHVHVVRSIEEFVGIDL